VLLCCRCVVHVKGGYMNVYGLTTSSRGGASRALREVRYCRPGLTLRKGFYQSCHYSVRGFHLLLQAVSFVFTAVLLREQ
jgi:hypothetical protein